MGGWHRIPFRTGSSLALASSAPGDRGQPAAGPSRCVPACPACGAAGKWESCVVEQPEPRTPLGVGLQLASKVTTIGLEFALPAAAGYGLDSWLRTTPVATVIGVVLGFLVGMMHAVRISREFAGGRPPRRPGA
jgi:ATP synthase protein I